MKKARLEILPDKLKLDGKELYLASGSMHYFRIHPDGWKRRLEYMKDFGLNTVQTYCPWNLHEKEEGRFDFSGMLDLAAFLRLCDEMDLKVLLRPSPFICSEWEFGGMPWWLLKNKNQALRCMDERFTKAVSNYYQALCRQFVPYLSTNGGPIIAVCIENEYGGYGSDKEYLRFLQDELTKNGVDVPFYATDNSGIALRTGSLPDTWVGINYRIESKEALAMLRKERPGFPAFVGEYWSGHSHYFGQDNYLRNPAVVARGYKEALEEGAMVNFYMFCGGTNFGFMNGARITTGFNHGEEQKYRAITTSYDTEALIGEDGYPTEKYYACRKVLDAFLGKPVREAETPERKWLKHEPLTFTACAPLFDNLNALSKPVYSAGLKTFEQLDLGYGFMLYETEISEDFEGKMPLKIVGLHDRAQVFVDGVYQGVLMRDISDEKILELTLDGKKHTLRLLVENMGRNNTGPHLRDEKGILEEVRLSSPNLFHWTHWPLPLDDMHGLRYDAPGTDNAPAFYRTQFTVDTPEDAHLVTEGFDKGVVFINGFNLGRYWHIGPQQSLYLPAGLLKAGKNEIIVLDLQGGSAQDKRILFADRPQWDIAGHLTDL